VLHAGNATRRLGQVRSYASRRSTFGLLGRNSAERRAYHSGAKKAELTKSGTGWYFKVGAYVQSSPEKGDKEGTPGAVAVYALKVTPTPTEAFRPAVHRSRCEYTDIGARAARVR
jgi:hypothetical protein